jgi:anti-sigma regulatory factor (Ser/Thr protein kinase)
MADLADDRSDEPHVRFEMLSQARFLAAARAMISNIAQRLGFAEIVCGQISLATDEALCNIINHGYDRKPDQRIWVNIWALDQEDPPRIRIVIEDRARQVDPATIRSRDLDDIRPGGLGVYIIREIMDEVHYEKRAGGGMRLTISKRVVNSPDAQETMGRSSDASSTQASGAQS